MSSVKERYEACVQERIREGMTPAAATRYADVLYAGELAAAGESSGGATAQWEALVEAKVAAGANRVAAVKAARLENPRLHAKMLAEVNRAAGATYAAAEWSGVASRT